MAPEIHAVRHGSDAYEALLTDIFALGVILFTTVLGRFPFEYAKDSDKLFGFLKEKNFERFW